jgi:hypothetical protein
VLELTGPQKKQLRDALKAAFPKWSELAKFTSDELDLNLAEITGDSQGVDTNAFDLIVWAASRGELASVVNAARNMRPADDRIAAFADGVGLTSLTASNLQKFVTDNQVLLNPVVWRKGQIESEWRVCRIDCAGDGRGTGILVGPDLVLTNCHVVQSLIDAPEELHKWCARFDHKLAENGKDILPGFTVDFADEWNVDSAPYSKIDTLPDPKPGAPTNDELDFALVRLAKPIGNEALAPNSEQLRGWVPLRATVIDYTATKMVAILQHPQARPLKLALGTSEKLVLNTPKNRLRHGIPTEQGSSGSPLFDQEWNLIALHHAGDPKTIAPSYNEAIPIELIAARPKVKAALPA